MYFERLFNGRARSRRWIWGSQSIEECGKEFLSTDMGELAPITEDELGLYGSISKWRYGRGLRRNWISYTGKYRS